VFGKKEYFNAIVLFALNHSLSSFDIHISSSNRKSRLICSVLNTTTKNNIDLKSFFVTFQLQQGEHFAGCTMAYQLNTLKKNN